MSGEEHKLYGNNRHFFQGRFISGPDCRSSFASFTMIVVPSALWQGQVGPFYTERYSVIFALFLAVLQVSSVVSLICTAFADPGIMPRAKDYTEAFDSRTKLSRIKPPPRYHDLVLRGHPSKIKYCTTCNIYRPPRCTHCSVCENCIERFDHHCPWLGNCIGKRNYWLFFTFVSTTAALNVASLSSSAALLAIVTQDVKDIEGKGGGDAFVQAMSEEPSAVIIAVYSAAIVWFTVGLCMYHTYLICTNQTTYEQIKGVYTTGTNPFHRGISGNCQDILCGRVRPRYFNAADNKGMGRLIWNVTPADEAAREIRVSGRGEKKYLVSANDRLKGPREGAQAQPVTSAVTNDPFLNLTAAGANKWKDDPNTSKVVDGDGVWKGAANL